MKKIFLFAFASITFFSCKPYEQQIAEECIKSHLKCPSSLKVVSFSSSYIDASQSIDTSYHVRSINEHARTVRIDSVRREVSTYPAHYYCMITFDAQNPMGAMIRYSETVVVEGGRGFLWNDWFDYRYRLSKDSIWVERTTKKPESMYSIYGRGWYRKKDFID